MIIVAAAVISNAASATKKYMDLRKMGKLSGSLAAVCADVDPIVGGPVQWFEIF